MIGIVPESVENIYLFWKKITIQYNAIVFYSLSSSIGKHKGNINTHVVRKNVIKKRQLIHNSRLDGYKHGRKHCFKRRKR